MRRTPEEVELLRAAGVNRARHAPSLADGNSGAVGSGVRYVPTFFPLPGHANDIHYRYFLGQGASLARFVFPIFSALTAARVLSPNFVINFCDNFVMIVVLMMMMMLSHAGNFSLAFVPGAS